MKRAAGIVLAVFAALLASTIATAAQTGAIEFTVRATPAAGRSEPVRGFPFYLLRKSYADIRKEAEASQPSPDMSAFIDRLEVSPEMKAWMKRTKSVSLSGPSFTHRVKIDDMLNVPEFYQAYIELNAGDLAIGFPVAKYREKDRLSNPQKYAKQKAEYRDAVRHFLVSNPQSADTLDLRLMDIDPSHRWEQIEAQRGVEIRRQMHELAETRYLAGRTDTDLDGNGFFRGLSPGQYWLSSLDLDASVGDVQLRWDTPVTVRAGETTRIELSNINAVEPRRNPR
jgi:hypothetical protein